ncbi:MAG: peptide ABC transporter substrate-binding protein [Chelatococcus sp.]|uniref:ABC transporter substrate-binding protein n=1 Tax=Chelatococcus sp. TaxID=1953771 RepID=UPI0025C6BA05|nr:ABC transporter substrate-binding protein [Chelatococcus sp.]MBX3539924.1 peptide ABC transporter substrate-binding protein [Chelatococcus sp.]
MQLTRRSLIAAGIALPCLGTTRGFAAGKETLTFGLSAYPGAFSVWGQVGTAATTVKLMTHRGLLSFDHKGEIQPEIAESFARVGDAGWTFKLREAVFHDGRPVTSADVKWSFEQVAQDNSTAYYRAVMQGVQAIETPDARTVTIVMKEPLSTLPLILAMPHMMIVPKDTTFERSTLPMGAGPYKLVRQERGVALDFERFDKFYKPGLPKMAKLRMVAYADETLRVSALKSGDVDLIEYVPWQAMAEIEADKKFKLETTLGPFMYLTFNGQSGPFADKRVRQAVAYGVKRDDIVKSAFFGRGGLLEGMPLAKESPFYDPATANHFAFDPAKAKALLAEAGHPNGFACKLLSNAQYGMHRSTAEVVQQSLAAIGIQAELNLPDYATYTTLGNRGQYDMAVVGNTADYNDPDGLASLIDGTLPVSFVRSFKLDVPEIHALLAEGRRTFEPEARKAVYKKLETAFLDQVPLAPLAWREQGYAMKTAVDGFVNLPSQLTFFSGMTLETTAIA